MRGKYGNALVSKLPILDHRTTHLNGGSERILPVGTKKLNGDVVKSEDERHRLVRGFLECDVQVHPVLGVDHQGSDVTRFSQENLHLS